MGEVERAEEAGEVENVDTVAEAERAEDVEKLTELELEGVGGPDEIAEVEDAAEPDDAAELEDEAALEDLVKLEDVVEPEDVEELEGVEEVAEVEVIVELDGVEEIVGLDEVEDGGTAAGVEDIEASTVGADRPVEFITTRAASTSTVLRLTPDTTLPIVMVLTGVLVGTLASPVGSQALTTVPPSCSRTVGRVSR